MSNISLGQYLKDSPKINNEYPTDNHIRGNDEPVNEVLLTLIAASVLAYTCQPLLNTDFMKSIGGGLGMMFGGIGSMFGFGRNKDNDEKDSKKDDKGDKKSDNDSKKNKNDKNDGDDKPDGDNDSETKNANDMMQNMFAFCQKHIDKEKDENKKKSLTGMLDVYRAASVDDDGNPVPLDKIAERFEQITGQKPEDWAKENGVEMPSKEEIEKINKAANDEIGKMSPEERKKVADEGRTKAKSTCAEIKKQREEIEAEQKELDELKQKAEASKDPKEQKSLWGQVKEKGNNLANKMKRVAGGIFGSKAISAAQETAEQASNNAEKPEGNSDDNPDGNSGDQGNDIEKAKKASEDAAAAEKSAKEALDTAEKALKENTDDSKKEELEKAANDAKEAHEEASAAAKEAKEAYEKVQSSKNDDETVESIEKATEAAKQAKAEADKAVSSAEEAVKNAPDDKKEELEKALADAKSKQADAEKESKKADDAEKETKTYELTHDGKPDKLIKRKKLRGEGHVWCWASDKKTTVAPDQAREMLKKANIKEGLSLSDWLKTRL